MLVFLPFDWPYNSIHSKSLMPVDLEILIVTVGFEWCYPVLYALVSKMVFFWQAHWAFSARPLRSTGRHKINDSSRKRKKLYSRRKVQLWNYPTFLPFSPSISLFSYLCTSDLFWIVVMFSCFTLDTIPVPFQQVPVGTTMRPGSGEGGGSGPYKAFGYVIYCFLVKFTD